MELDELIYYISTNQKWFNDFCRLYISNKELFNLLLLNKKVYGVMKRLIKKTTFTFNYQMIKDHVYKNVLQKTMNQYTLYVDNTCRLKVRYTQKHQKFEGEVILKMPEVFRLYFMKDGMELILEDKEPQITEKMFVGYFPVKRTRFENDRRLVIEMTSRHAIEYETVAPEDNLEHPQGPLIED